PVRGAMGDTTAVKVVGRVSDEGTGVTGVRVNDQVANLSGDRFEIEIAGVVGINLVETRALDGAGNSAVDSRAVLLGTLVDQGTPIAGGVVAKLDAVAMEGLDRVVSNLAAGTDFTALAKAANPVVNTGDGCNSAKAYVDSLATGDVPVR